VFIPCACSYRLPNVVRLLPLVRVHPFRPWSCLRSLISPFCYDDDDGLSPIALNRDQKEALHGLPALHYTRKRIFFFIRGLQYTRKRIFSGLYFVASGAFSFLRKGSWLCTCTYRDFGFFSFVLSFFDPLHVTPSTNTLSAMPFYLSRTRRL